ncbi:TPA: hypothetical protein MCA61_000919 [Klebsiella pneumoniae]|uniref:hypothetical protein n=1 Tax=Klebsiella pneumoniae TaxID=573 RepID=UPI001C58C83D|nr:hypothetical protein [Klebsiella pneumoniae]MBW3339410.1 hypothetical protein [Klebsiella pneumoniae]MDK9413073.1 hypothetical protein [Klebsiella pneumoniae]HBT5723204.1 hypothetical protein [Klebsiella pneumoniae]HBT5779291.1 hypothetical protein [Klebsiella pneumoniae]HEL4363861.1 hypothetical protein [Klebsiella pneumoniae]
MKKEEEPITTFIWCGAVVKVYVQVVKLAGTTIQRHLLPTNLRRAVDQQVAGAANHQEASPRRVQHYQRREGNAEQSHYGVSARAMQRRNK